MYQLFSMYPTVDWSVLHTHSNNVFMLRTTKTAKTNAPLRPLPNLVHQLPSELSSTAPLKPYCSIAARILAI